MSGTSDSALCSREHFSLLFLSHGSGGAFYLRQVSGCGRVSINLEIAQIVDGKIRRIEKKVSFPKIKAPSQFA